MPPPRKKDRLRAVCPRRENIFRPQRRSAAGSQICRAKDARTRAQKQPPAEAGSCAQTAPWGERQAMEVSGAGKHHTGHPVGQRARPGAKTAPGGGRELCAGCAHGRAAGNGVSGARQAPHWATAGARGTPGRKNSPRRGPEAVWMRDMGVTCPGRSV